MMEQEEDILKELKASAKIVWDAIPEIRKYWEEDYRKYEDKCIERSYKSIERIVRTGAGEVH